MFIKLLKINNFSKVLFSSFLLLAGIVSLSSADELKKVTHTKNRWMFAPAFNMGYNSLLEGYDGYDNLANVGGDLYIRAPTFNPFSDAGKIVQRFYLRFSYDHFPLQVPKELLGLDEEMDVFSLNVIYQFRNDRLLGKPIIFNPFIGIGFGFYRDTLTLNTPASGQVEGTVENEGLIGSIGLFLPVIKLGPIPLRIIPEIRYHRVNIPGGEATNMTYQAAIAWWPG